MSELPQIDPSWTRPRQVAVKDDSPIWLALIMLVVVALVLWVFQTEARFNEVRTSATAQTRAILARARIEQTQHRALGSSADRYVSESKAARRFPAENRLYSDNAIHRCVSGTVDTYQLGGCKPPLVDAGYARTQPRQYSSAEQAQLRLRAEAQLVAEQRRFAALTGQNAQSSATYYQTVPVDAHQRCAWAKAERDDAYRVAGSNRTFDFIRHWNEVVYEACKNT